MTQQTKNNPTSNSHIALAMETILEFREKVGKTPEDVSFNHLIYTDSDFSRTNLSTGIFKQTVFKNTRFVETKFTSAILRGTDLSEADLLDADLTGADLSEANLRNVRNLTQEQFDQIIYEQGMPPQNIPEQLTLPQDRAYVWEEDRRRFVQSDKSWSGKLVEDV